MAAQDPKPLADARWRETLAEPGRAHEILRDPEHLKVFVARVRELESAHQETLLLHEFTLEHSNEIEDQLAEKVDEVQALVLDLEVRNSFIREVFGRYMSDGVVRTLLESPGALRLGGEKRRITILMSDLRGFSLLCEHLPPEQVVCSLNTYLAAMADVIGAHEGTINDFIGDAILALFGVPLQRPDDAERAIACALAMQRAMTAVNQELREAGLPGLEMGIGVHTGEVVIGNIGSSKRAKYGVVGSPVNLASRIESYTVGGQVLVSHTTLAQTRARVVTGESFEVTPKGIDAPLMIHEVLGLRGEHRVDLPARDIEPQLLAAPQPVELAVIEGKDVGERRLQAAFLALAPEAATLAGAAELQARTDVKITLVGQGAPHDASLYGKIMPRDVSGRTLVRFTALSPRARSWIEGTLHGARAGSSSPPLEETTV